MKSLLPREMSGSGGLARSFLTSCSLLLLPLISTVIVAAEPRCLWTQYGVANRTLKLALHTDADPLQPTSAIARLYIHSDSDWQQVSESNVEPLTAMATFRIEDWDSSVSRAYRVTCGESQWEGIIRAEPPASSGTLKMVAIACVKDDFFPQANAVADTIRHDPDLVFFAGDQIYESNSGGQIVVASNEKDVPAAMANYLTKWRKFGAMFRNLLKDRPSVIITDDHDVYANDLWGRGGRRMTGDRTTGGYRMHPSWVNAAERTQTWHLPDAVRPGPWGDGILAYYTSLEYGGVHFAILEDRKFKSAPSEVLSEPVSAPSARRKNQNMEVIEDPAFDTMQLDRPDLELLGEDQERFLHDWASPDDFGRHSLRNIAATRHRTLG